MNSRHATKGNPYATHALARSLDFRDQSPSWVIELSGKEINRAKANRLEIVLWLIRQHLQQRGQP